VFVEEQEIARHGAWEYLVTLRDSFVPEAWAFWRVGLREPLPTIALPLTPDVAPVPLDLQAAFTRCYDANYIARRVNYAREIAVPPFTPEDAAWADALLRGAGLR
ncbi:MAG: DUF4058 family protein, partial [Armatimonadetes bacterium]|nr:DUF4058 family protein [Armatimonadota bacterium]